MKRHTHTPAQVVQMYREGVKCKEISAVTGRSVTSIWNVIARARAAGKLPPHKRTAKGTIKNCVDKGGLRVGHIGAELAKCEYEFAKWVISQLQEKETIADYAIRLMQQEYTKSK